MTWHNAEFVKPQDESDGRKATRYVVVWLANNEWRRAYYLYGEWVRCRDVIAWADVEKPAQLETPNHT